MLQNIKQLYGEKLSATDGEIGHVKDFYFDDRSWVVRYLVADTGTWLPGRQVLLSPHAFGGLHHDGKFLHVSLTRKQIEDSPAIETHTPVSRQYEEDYHRYYGWPYYWEGDGLWGGMRGFPVLEVPPKFSLEADAAPVIPKSEQAEAHLRSTKAVKGYNIEASNGTAGYVCGFMMDEESWAIGQLVVKTGNRFSGNEVLISVSNVDRISYEKSTVFVKLDKKAVEQSTAYFFFPVGAVAQPQPSYL